MVAVLGEHGDRARSRRASNRQFGGRPGAKVPQALHIARIKLAA
jgi:hypothetical protein